MKIYQMKHSTELYYNTLPKLDAGGRYKKYHGDGDKRVYKIEKGVTMENFMDLREFMLLEEPYADQRSVHNGSLLETRGYTCPAWDFVKRYDIAKSQWEKWGNGTNILVGSKVRTIRSGFGGRTFHIFKGVYEKDERYYWISHEEAMYGEVRCLVPICMWWLYFEVLEEGSQNT